jgi:GNAT superfamily N-acetyltransferase
MREYPETVAGPYDPPPVEFTDRAERSIAVHRYGEGPVEDELAALVSMYVGYNPEDRAQGIPPTGEENVRDWLDRITEPGCHNVVAWHGEQVAGHATLVPDRGGPYELAIFVDHDYQEAGIGTHLMQALLGFGREEGVEKVWLSVERWNTPAVSLYRKIGFDSTGDAGFELEMAARLTEDD